MDRLPYVFLESVAAALNKSDLEQLLLISGTWSSAASIHHAKRHNLEVLLSPSDQDDGEVEVDFIIPETGDQELTEGKLCGPSAFPITFFYDLYTDSVTFPEEWRNSGQPARWTSPALSSTLEVKIQGKEIVCKIVQNPPV
ncbi:hypothetical protein QR680_007035 [Steinernema hermaphroditum]|uniref:F-box domain-containing protein n=1 Tax=Steinernema hermaphroditum TaxID=289476 RepID=A0AA39LY35_9BILA|nr:hypothetical protein QR680_007035 [Steinernema hermaphroditum]